jgi:sugar/nucleoside kinase (ribokinase family)
MDRQGIAAAGNWIVDRVKTIDVWPEQDTLATILDERIGNGGGPFNVLADLAKLRSPFPLEAVGLVGDDVDGWWILEACQKLGIATGQLSAIEGITSYTDVMSVQATGRRTFFHQRGTNAVFAPEHVEISALAARIFYLGYALLLDEMDKPDSGFGTKAGRVLAQAREAGMKTALDVVSEGSDRYETVVVPTLRHVDWLFVNEFEAGKTTGLTLRPGRDLDKAAMEHAGLRLLDHGVAEVVFIHAPEGAMAIPRGQFRIWQPSVAVPPEEIAGTVGAGDAFCAGVLHGLHEGKELKESLVFGVSAAAASLRHPSASDGVVDLESCLDLGKAHGFRVNGSALPAA